MRLETFHDPEYGTIAVARDDDGEIVATAVDVVTNGVRIIMDETAIYEATGQLMAPTPGQIAGRCPVVGHCWSDDSDGCGRALAAGTHRGGCCYCHSLPPGADR